MPTNSESLNRELYRLLSKYKPKPLDATGKSTPVPEEADIFKFEFTKDGDDYGTVFVTLDEDRVLTVYYGDDVAGSPSDRTPKIDYDDTWNGLLHQLSSWRMTKGLRGFKTQNKDHVNDDMARRNHMRNKDKIAEGYYPMGRKASYSDAIPTVKIVIEHSRVIEEGEKRYRNINRIFLENQDGERYLLDTKKPGVARVYARHIAEGGKVNDDRWNHVHSLCEEYSKMAGFVRATRNGQFNESAQSLVNEGIAHYQSLRESLSRMTGKRGYNAYFESWTPPLMEDGTEENNLNELFVQETLDPRIESVMPILNRIHKKVSESIVDKEMNKLAEWADSLVEDESIKADKNPGGIPEEEEVDEAITPGASLKRFKDDPRGNQKLPATPKKELDEFDIDTLNQLASHPMAGPLAAAGGAAIGATIGKGITKAADWYKNRQEKKAQNYDMRGNKVAEEVDTGQYDAVKPISNSGTTPEQEKEFRKKVQAYGKELDQRQKEKAEKTDKGLDANQKRVGQLGPTEKVKNNNIGKLVGANENFINQADQAVVSEEDEMAEGVLDAIKRGVAGAKQFGKEVKDSTKQAWDEEWPKIKQDWQHPIQTALAKEGEMDEGTHTQHDSDLNPDDYERPPTDWSVDPIEAGTDRIHNKISSMLKKLSKPKNSQDLDEAAAPWEDEDEAEKREKEDKENKDTKGSDGAEHGGHSRAKHLAKNAIPKEKEEVKEGQDDLDRILAIMNHRR